MEEKDKGADRKRNEENEKEKKKEDKEKKDKKDKEEDEPTVIDLEGMESRVVILPVDAGNIGDLAAVKDKVIYIRYPNSGLGDNEASLYYFDLKEREEVKIIGEVYFFQLSQNGKKILDRKRTRLNSSH